MNKILRNIIGFSILIISTGNSFASSANAFFLVSATVLPSCIVTATPLAFGTYVTTADSLQTNTLTITCTLGTAYTVSLNAGIAPAATTSTRKMTGLVNTSSFLPYNLYSNAARTQNWGNQSSDWVPGTGTGLAQTLTVYGKIPQGANVPSDTYRIILFIPVSFADEIAGDSELIVSLKVNYAETDIFPTIVQNTQGHYLIPLEDIEHFDVQEDYLKQAIVNYHDTDYINLDLLQGTKYDLNFENLDLNITFPASKMMAQSFDASGGPMKNVDTKFISGAYLNYDVTLSQNDDINYLAGVEELNYFTENGVYSYSFLFQTEAVKSNFSKTKNTTKNQNKFTRLETHWTYENVDKMTSWRVGG